MLSLGGFAFASPWLLLGFVVVPALWWLLRVTPPAPRRIPFPALRLLLGLTPREETPARTPLWGPNCKQSSGAAQTLRGRVRYRLPTVKTRAVPGNLPGSE